MVKDPVDVIGSVAPSGGDLQLDATEDCQGRGQSLGAPPLTV
jgi:hypothetical protein